MSDLVFAQGPQLAERCSRRGKRAEVFPFGVNLDRFAGTSGEAEENRAAVAKSCSASEFMASLPRPVIGYVGGIHKFVDVEMLAAMARAKPDWSWVLVGPLQASPGELKRMSNIHLAMGKAVVSTDLPEVRTFNGKHGVIITSPNRELEFVASIEKALRLFDDEIVSWRRTVAALNNWEERFVRMSHLVETELREKSSRTVNQN
jgi:hypothetical protein